MSYYRQLLVSTLVALPLLCNADYLIVGRSATLKKDHTRDSEIYDNLPVGTVLELLSTEKKDGYYKARVVTTNTTGWIYQTLVRRFTGNAPSSGGSVSGTGLSVMPALSLNFIMPEAEPGDVLIAHEGYTSCMSTDYNIPRWVAHRVSSQLLQGDGKRGEGSAYPKDVAYPSIRGTAYASSGYDHGHLAPAGDFKVTQKQTDESFYMTNMAPQYACMNRKGWCVLESNVRNWARQSPGSMFYVISGPVLNEFIDSLCINEETTVYVPAQFYKVVIEQTSAGQIHAAAFLVANTDVTFADLPGGQISVDDAEAITGIDFMPALTTSQEKIESTLFKFDLKDLPECPGRNTACETLYKTMTNPDKRTKSKCE